MSTPWRFTARSGLRYAKIIHKIVDTFPAILTIDPEGLSVETYSCRLRDAMRGLAAEQWHLPSLDFEKFLEVHSKVSVGIRNDKVVVGPRSELRAAKALPTVGVTAGSAKELTVSTTSAEIIKALAVLHHHRILSAPSRITGIVPAELIDGLDVELITEGDCTIMM